MSGNNEQNGSVPEREPIISAYIKFFDNDGEEQDYESHSEYLFPAAKNDALIRDLIERLGDRAPKNAGAVEMSWKISDMPNCLPSQADINEINYLAERLNGMNGDERDVFWSISKRNGWAIVGLLANRQNIQKRILSAKK